MALRRRFAQRSNLHPVNRIKHVIDKQAAVALGVSNVTNLIFSVQDPALANREECLTGSTVNGIYLKVEINATSSGALSNAYMLIFKNPGGNTVAPAANVVGASDNKKFVIHQEMVMLQQVTNSNPRTLFNGVIAIPRGYRRNAPDDRLELHVLMPGTNGNLCIQCHYKEFR